MATRREQLAIGAAHLRDAILSLYSVTPGESDEADVLYAALITARATVDLLGGQRECVAGETVVVIGTQRVGS